MTPCDDCHLSVSCRIVGDDDGGELFNPDEYDTYKKKVLPMVRQCTVNSPV